MQSATKAPEKTSRLSEKTTERLAIGGTAALICTLLTLAINEAVDLSRRIEARKASNIAAKFITEQMRRCFPPDREAQNQPHHTPCQITRNPANNSFNISGTTEKTGITFELTIRQTAPPKLNHLGELVRGKEQITLYQDTVYRNTTEDLSITKIDPESDFIASRTTTITATGDKVHTIKIKQEEIKPWGKTQKTTPVAYQPQKGEADLLLKTVRRVEAQLPSNPNQSSQ